MEIKVAKITPSTNGGFVITLDEVRTDSKIVKTAFGEQKQSQFGERFYTKVETTELKEGDKLAVNLSDFNHVMRPFTTNEGTNIECHWLFLK